MKHIEKQLIKTAKLLPLMEKEIVLLEDANTSKTSYNKFLRMVAKPVLLLLVGCCITLSVSAQVRESVFVFFKTMVQEIIPSFYNTELLNADNSLILVGHNEIKNVADVYYYDLTNFKTDGNLIINGDTDREYYSLNYGDMNKVESVERIEETITVNGKKILLKFDIVNFNDRKLIYNYNDYKVNKSSDISASAIKSYANKQVWIQTVDRSQLRTQIDVLLYNTETGEIKDVFGEFLPDNFEIENVMFNQSGEYILLQEFDRESKKGLFNLFDVEKKEIVTLENLTSITTVVTCSFVDDKLIYITASPTEAIDEEKLNGFVYNLADGRLTQIYSIYDKSVFTNGLITIKQGTECYEIVYHTGEIYKLQNINLDGLTFLSNPTGTKVAVQNLGESVSGSLNVTELGLIDIDAKTFKIFKRKVVAESKEHSVGWDMMDNLIITTDRMLYQYVFK